MTTLKQEIKRLLELDAKRPGSYEFMKASIVDGQRYVQLGYSDDSALAYDAYRFLLAAPSMMEVIRHQAKLLDAAREALASCCVGHNSQDYYQYFDEETVHSALAQLQQARGEG